MEDSGGRLRMEGLGPGIEYIPKLSVESEMREHKGSVAYKTPAR